MFTGVSGLQSNSQAISVIGNNIANSNTVGFKSSSTLFSDLLYQNIGNNSQVGTGEKVQLVRTNYTGGSMANSTSVTDVAIQGNSFFALAAPGATAAVNQNAAYLTRAGEFNVDTAYHLVNPDGYEAVQANGGTPILFQHNTPPAAVVAGDYAKVTAIDSRGVITYQDLQGNSFYYNGNGAAGLPVSTANYNTVLTAGNVIAVVNPTNPNGLAKIGNNLYQSTGASGVPAAAFTAAANTANGTSETMLSNYLESSNVDMATELVNMLTTQRAYSANSKTITTADQMIQETLGLVR